MLITTQNPYLESFRKNKDSLRHLYADKYQKITPATLDHRFNGTAIIASTPHINVSDRDK